MIPASGVSLPRLIVWRLGVLGLALALACATPPGEPADAVRSDYDRALRAGAEGPAAARAALRDFIDTHPRSPLADDAGLRLARLALEAGDEGAAERALRGVLDRHPSGDASDAVRLELAQLLHAQQRDAEARGIAQRIRLSLLDGSDRRAAHRLLADLADLAAGGDSPALHLRWLGQVRVEQETPEGARDLDAEIDAVIAGLDRAALEGAAAGLGTRVPAARVRARLAVLAAEAGQLEEARAQLARANRLPLTPAGAQAIRSAELRLQQPPGYPGGGGLEWPEEALPALTPLGLDPSGANAVLGVVLPLSGPYAAFGRETLQGIGLALGLFGPEGPTASGLELLVRDSRGDPARAAAAVAELSEVPGLLAVLGPLVGRAAGAAAQVAAERGVPLLTLTQREEVAAAGAWVLRLGGTPRVEAERIADYAIRDLGARRFALLYPDDDSGRSLRAVFWDAVEARGGEVTAVARYDVGATDFAAPIRRLIGYELLDRAEREALAERERLLKRAKRLPLEEANELRREAWLLRGPDERELPPFVDFDALFIPDSHRAVALIGPHLAFHDVRGVRLLGVSGWNHPELLEIGGRHLDGAVFTARFFPGSQEPEVADFRAAYLESFGVEPGFIAAQGFDAASLLLRGLLQGAADRESLLEALLATPPTAGTTGALLGFDEAGSLVRREPLLGIERARIFSVDERGEPPTVPPPPVRPWELEEDEALEAAAD